MALLAGIAGPTGAFLAWLALKPYSRAVDAADARGD
jgi:hypothetical protein